MTSHDFASMLAELLVGDSSSPVTSAGVTHAASPAGGRLRPALDVELASGDRFRIVVDRVELEAAS